MTAQACECTPAGRWPAPPLLRVAHGPWRPPYARNRGLRAGPGACRRGASLGALVDTALAPLDATEGDRAVPRAMVDINTWQALGDQGLGPDEAVAAISDMLAGRLIAQRASSASGR